MKLPHPRHRVVVNFGKNDCRSNAAQRHRRLHHNGIDSADFPVLVQAVNQQGAEYRQTGAAQQQQPVGLFKISAYGRKNIFYYL